MVPARARRVSALARGVALDYYGRTMVQKRSGRTVKVSVSLHREDLAVLQRHAKESHNGNLSAAFAEAAKWIRQRQARRRLIDKLGGPILTAESAATIDAEQRGVRRHDPKKSKPRKAA